MTKAEEGRPPNRRWLQMGGELEGGWAKGYTEVAPTVLGAVARRDGSLKGFRYLAGEITTRPHGLLKGLLDDLEKLHPDECNESAGFHIHTSFTPLDTSLLTTQAFWDYFRMRWEVWGKSNEGAMTKAERAWFWNRFHERTPEAQQYCKAQFIPDKQLADTQPKGKTRYAQLNFNAYHSFKTVECRLLPMFQTKEILASAVKELSDIYDSYLNGEVEIGGKFEKKVIQANEEVQEILELKSPDISFWEEEKRLVGPDLPCGEGICYHIPGAEGAMLPYVEDAGVAQ